MSNAWKTYSCFFYQFIYLFTDGFLVITYGYVQSHHLQFISHASAFLALSISFPTAALFTFYIGRILAQSATKERNPIWKGTKSFSFPQKVQINPKVFRHSSDIVADAPQGLPCKHITSYFPAFQVISVISPPGLPAEMADRRIWRMKAIVRQFVFCVLS